MQYPTLGGRSLSSGALQTAAQMKLTHVPKRCTQHSVCLPGYETLPTTLKTGQLRVERSVYTEEAKKLQETYMEAELPAMSNYMRSHSSQTRPQDYSYQRAIKPGEPSEEGGHRGCSHWRSTSNAAHGHEALAGAVHHRQNGPSYQALNPPTCVGQGVQNSSYGEDYGAYGSNPREKMIAGHPKMPTFKGPLTFGTPKGTDHMPGYQGFLPTCTANDYVRRVESGAFLRSTDKSNLTEEFHTNLVGYAGHVAKNANNDRGPIQPNTLTTAGNTYRKPPSGGDI